MYIKESSLRAQLIELNDEYLSGLMPHIEWIAKLKTLKTQADNLGIELFNEGGN